MLSVFVACGRGCLLHAFGVDFQSFSFDRRNISFPHPRCYKTGGRLDVLYQEGPTSADTVPGHNAPRLWLVTLYILLSFQPKIESRPFSSVRQHILLCP